ncbi:MAG TPA: PH domain-containing protein [Candidatus Paceibacterota bacterium]|nr:PH domain-containing protein [Candidatus Paceibacterota bacterium]
MAEFRLEPGEHIARAVRKHWFVHVLEVLPFALLALFPFLIPSLLSFVASNSPTTLTGLLSALTTDNPWVRLLLGLWWLVMWVAAFNAFTSYYLNQWIITSHRIIEINQRGFFNREVSSILLNHVQDVTSDVRGLFATLLGYGTITIQSAGADTFFHMQGIENPTALRDLVMREIAQLHGHTEKPGILERLV